MLVFFIGFSSTGMLPVFAAEDFVHRTGPLIFDSSLNYNLIDVRPLTLDQIIPSPPQLSSEEINNLLSLLLFSVPFGVLVFRMSDEESLSKRFLKLSSIIIFVGMGSLFMSQAVVTGNFYWGYAVVYADAYTELEPEVILPDAIDTLRFDHFDKDNISFEGGAVILEQENNAIMYV